MWLPALILHRTSFVRIITLFSAVLFLACLPIVSRDPYILHLMIMWLIWTIATCSWAVLVGFVGIFHFAQIAFFGIGGYASALLSLKTGLHPWAGILFGGLVASIVSLCLSLPSLRLRGSYIAVVSLGFSECSRIAINNLSFTKAELGLWRIPPLWRSGGKIGFYYSILIVAILVVSFIYIIITSKYGLALRAIKESSISAESLGIEIYKVKILLFCGSAFMAGIAGGFYVHYMTGISPEIFNISNMIDIMVMGIIGGINSIFGPILGVIIVLFSLEYLRGIQEARLMVYAAAMIVIMIFRPKGLYSIVDQSFKRLEEFRLKSYRGKLKL